MNADAVVVGAGVIGCSIAYQLAKRGLRPVVVERGDIASGSSGACDEAILLQSKNPGPHLQLALASVSMFDELADEFGAEIEYAREGGMVVVEKEEELEAMRAFVRRQKAAGLSVELLTCREARRIQPAIATSVAGATWSDMDARVNPLRLTFAFARAARQLGARIITGTEVTGVVISGGKVAGVQTSSGMIWSPYVVNAAGVWAPELGKLVGLRIPIKPRRGQIMVSERLPPMIRGDMLCARYIAAKFGMSALTARGSTGRSSRFGIGLSLGQSKSGNLLLGGSREFVGFDRRTSLEVLAAIAEHAIRLVPGIRDVSFIRSFAGLRPYTPDGLPILGAVEDVPGFVMAAGHEGDGIALSPITGRLIAELITEGATSIPLEPFGLSRFRGRAGEACA